ncbi:adenylate/guanylate cyclase domain-containing protein [Undibacterium pigrum]|uniref:Class 3 adenylate cyclase n=1 Tax=Undibacterium pigrum TaxID=401470 RepID=A0A318J3P9_9BURK|nr:adenylate/guanylate cyclase domain-containing protein [Undibacterium pigrum]PXX43246.1 class 3 adenylate cyclase [Undibacterium pigrum]
MTKTRSLQKFFTPRLLQALGLLILLALAMLLLHLPAVHLVDNKVLDLQFSLSRAYFPQHVDIDPVVVGLDEAFLDEVDEPLSLNHIHLANFLRAMNQAGVKVVGMDLSLPEKRFDTLVSTRKDAQDFHKTLLAGLLETIQTTPVVVAKVWDMKHAHYRDIQLDYAGILGMQGEQFQAVASAEFCRDSDQRIRRFPGADCQPDRIARGLATEIAAAAGMRREWSGLINYRLGAPFKYVPLQEVLKLAQQGKVTELQQRFGGKVVLLGATMDAVDLVDLPVSLAGWLPANDPNPGVLAHAQLLRSLLNQRLLQQASTASLFALSALFALFWLGRSIRIKLIVFLMASLGLLAASGIAMQYDVWLPPTAIFLTGLLALAGSAAWQAWQHYVDKQRLSKAFSGRVSPAVMQEIVEGRIDQTSQSRRLPVCVLFSDIRGFTTLCEHAQAEDVVSLLNRYFAVMSKIVHDHGGTIDKFIGDGLMAFFGAPQKLDNPSQNAFNASREMLAALSILNQELQAEGKAVLQIGIGLHAGDAVIGQVGSAERHEYTAIGDTVNTAARIEGLCKDVGYPVVCSATVVARLAEADALIALGDKNLKGRSAIAVYGWHPVQA